MAVVVLLEVPRFRIVLRGQCSGGFLICYLIGSAAWFWCCANGDKVLLLSVYFASVVMGEHGLYPQLCASDLLRSLYIVHELCQLWVSL